MRKAFAAYRALPIPMQVLVNLSLLFLLAVIALAALSRLKFNFEPDLYRVAPTNHGLRSFEPVGWHSGSATLRHEMAQWMFASGELIGETRPRLIERLGPPKNVGNDWGSDGAVWMEWDLGERQSPVVMLGNYHDYLRVVLDKCGQVDEVHMWDYD